MPQIGAAIAAAVTYIGGASAAVAAGTATFAQTAAVAATQAAIGAALSAATTALMAPKVGAGGSPTAFKADPAAPIRGVMGRFGTGGTQIHMRSWGGENVFLSYMTALSLGPIASIAGFTANGTAVTFPGAQGAAALVEPYRDKMWQTYKLGLPTDAALGPPTGQGQGTPSMTEWTSAHKTSGHAAVFWTMRNNSKRAGYEGGVPQPLWLVTGMLVYDPRLDSTYPGGSGPQRRDNWSTWTYSENPYLHALAFTRGHFKNLAGGSIDKTKRLAGIGAPDRGIDIASFVEGANVADANGWVISGEWTTADDKWSTLAAMLQAGGGVPLNSGAQIGVMVNTPRASLLTYTRSDLVGPANLKVMASRRDRFNTVIPRYREEAQKWEVVAAGALTSSAYLTEDRGEPRTREIEYSFVRKAKQAAELAAYDLVNSREGLNTSLPSKPHLLGLRAGDAFTIDADELGLNGQKVIVLRRSFNPEDATVTLEVRSETDAKHDWALGRTASPPPTPSLSIVSGSEVTTPTVGAWSAAAEQITSSNGQIPIIRITGAIDNAAISLVIVDYKPTAKTAWSTKSFPPSSTDIELSGLTGATAYNVRIRYANALGIEDDTAYRSLGTITTGNYVNGEGVIVDADGNPVSIGDLLDPRPYSRDRNKGGFSDQSDLSISSNAALSTPLGSGQLRFTPNGTGTTAYLGWALGRPGDRVPIIRARVRAAGASIVAADWDGRLTYQTPALAHALTAGRFARATFPGVITSTKWRVIEFDASELTDYLTSTITGVRLYLVKPTSPALDIDWLEVGFREGATANTGALADKDAADFDADVTGDSKPAGFAGRIITGAETVNTTPNGYLALLPNGGARNEVKDCASIGVASDRATGFGIVTTEVRPGTITGMTQTLRTPTMGTHKRSVNSGTSWRGWTRDLSEEQKPLFGLDLEETAGVLATLANFKTGMGTAAFVQDQGALATQSSVLPSQVNISYGESLVPDAKMIDAAAWTFAGNMVLQPTNGRAASNGDPATTALVASGNMEVEPGGVYRAGWFLSSSGGGTWTGRVEIYWYQNDGSASAILPFSTGTLTTDRGARFLTAVAPADAYYAAIRARRSAGVGAGNAFFSKPKFQRVMSADLVADSAIQLNRHVVRQNGVTVVTDATAITAIGTAAFYENQTAWGTFTKPTAALQYLNDSGRIVDGRGLPLNASSGNGVVLSPEYPVLQALTNPHTSIRVVAATATFPNFSLSLPAATITGLTADKNYFVFRDLQTSSYLAVLAASATSYLASPDRYFLVGAQKTSVNSGGSVSPPPSPPPGSSPCPDPDVPVAMVGGGVRRAGDLREGDWVWTQHQDTLEWGAFEVTRVRMATNDKYRLDLTDGRSRQYAVGHRFFVDGRGWTRIEQLKSGMAIVGAAPGLVAQIRETGLGPVVQITVRDAQTYQTDGLLSHNVKPVGDL